MRLLKFVACLFLAIALFVSPELKAQTAATSLSPGTKGPKQPLLHEAEPGRINKKKHRKGVFSPGRQAGQKKGSYKHDARYEFWERIEETAKTKKRIIKELSKAQYSDPRYFGHKRIPKRRPPHKMRYCGECGIRH